jgi:hypothetical protein
MHVNLSEIFNGDDGEGAIRLLFREPAAGASRESMDRRL